MDRTHYQANRTCTIQRISTIKGVEGATRDEGTSPLTRIYIYGKRSTHTLPTAWRSTPLLRASVTSEVEESGLYSESLEEDPAF